MNHGLQLECKIQNIPFDFQFADEATADAFKVAIRELPSPDFTSGANGPLMQ